jgi:hypothetical protein
LRSVAPGMMLRAMNRTSQSFVSMPRLPVWGALAALVLPFAIACGGENDNLPPPPPPPPPPPAEVAPPPPPPAPVAPAAPPPPPVTLLQGTASPDPTPLPTVRFLAPTPGQTIPADKVNDFPIKLDVKNWATATGSSHIHLILDNRPYKPVYDPTKPVLMSEILKSELLPEGQHVLVAFPSRANHESVKTKGAVVVTEFYVGKSKTHAVDLKAPMLVYSRPKGDYKGDMANHVLVDFQLVNETLAEAKDHVHVAVTGPGIDAPLSADVTKFGAPYYLDNLQDGSYTVKLDLLKGDNTPIAGAWNSTTRQINIDHSAPKDSAAPPTAPAPATSPAH